MDITLKKLIETNKLSFVQKFDIITGVSRGMAQIHRMAYIHFDIKPANIFLLRNGFEFIPKIGDMNITRRERSEHSVTRSGTKKYMAPEYYSNKYTKKLDVFAFGLTFNELFGGNHSLDNTIITIVKEADIVFRPLIFACVSHDLNKRPSSKEIEKKLSFLNDEIKARTPNEFDLSLRNPPKEADKESESDEYETELENNSQVNKENLESVIKFGQNMLQSIITAIFDQTNKKGKISIKNNKISQYKKKRATNKCHFKNSSNFSIGNLVNDSLSLFRKDNVFERKSSSILFQDKESNQNNEYSNSLSEKFQNLKNFGKKILDDVRNNHSLNKAIFTMINDYAAIVSHPLDLSVTRN
jgi:serine/threonine protein kinase